MTASRVARPGRLLAVVVVLALVAPAAAPRRATPADEALAAGRAFLDRYVDDGRVVRRDQGGDTVSEGQAYGMLIAVGVGDRAAFEAIWSWTATNLQRADGLLAWRWANGRVVGRDPATDADLAAASALALAAERFHDNDLLVAAQHIAAAVLAAESVTVGSMRVLVAGPWARDERVVNPGYLMFNAMSRLWWATGDAGWAAVAASGRALLATTMASSPHLPPDWSRVAPDGTTTPTSGPDGRSTRFGYEATRALVQLAVDCRADGQRLAASAWPYFGTRAATDIRAEVTLGGRPLTTDRHPVMLVAAAASAQAAGHDDRSEALLDAATSLDRAHPTYYGAAWLALGRLWLDTSRLGGCRTA